MLGARLATVAVTLVSVILGTVVSPNTAAGYAPGVHASITSVTPSCLEIGTTAAMTVHAWVDDFESDGVYSVVFKVNGTVVAEKYTNYVERGDFTAQFRVPYASYVDVSAYARGVWGDSAPSTRRITIASDCSPAYTPPSAPLGVTITSPKSGVTFSAGPIDFAMGVTVPYGAQVQSVELYGLDPACSWCPYVRLGTDFSYPWGITWNAHQATRGTWTVYAKVTTTGGAVARSTQQSLTIREPGPQVTWTNPSAILQPGSNNLSVSVVPDSATVTSRVDFFSGSELLGSDSNAPYELGWISESGRYTLKAIAYDSAGRTGQAIHQVTVARAPSLTVEQPPEATELREPTSVTGMASADEAAAVGLRSLRATVGGRTIYTRSFGPGESAALATVAFQFEVNPYAASFGVQQLCVYTTDTVDQTTQDCRQIVLVPPPIDVAVNLDTPANESRLISGGWQSLTGSVEITPAFAPQVAEISVWVDGMEASLANRDGNNWTSASGEFADAVALYGRGWHEVRVRAQVGDTVRETNHRVWIYSTAQVSMDPGWHQVITIGQAVGLQARVYRTFGRGIEGAELTLQRRTRGFTSWQSVSHATSAADGTANFTVRPRATADYRVVFHGGGNSCCLGAKSWAAEGGVVPKFLVGLRHRRRATLVTGQIWPATANVPIALCPDGVNRCPYDARTRDTGRVHFRVPGRLQPNSYTLYSGRTTRWEPTQSRTFRIR